MDMQVAVAALLAGNKDVKMMLRVLGKTLQDALGEKVEIVRDKGGLLHRPSEDVKSIKVHLGEDDYEAQLGSRDAQCVVARTSGGIRIRSEALPIQQWLNRLLTALQDEAVNNQRALAALQNVIIGGTT